MGLVRNFREMSIVAGKCRRTSTEQASPRAAFGKSAKKNIFAPESPSSSSSQSPSPPRRRDSLKSMVLNAVRPRTVAPVPSYRGVRYREELNKYVSEIRPTRCSKKIWLGTYDTAEEAARAFDIGNLCCKKNLPLNFADSPNMLKRISSQLSPDEARSAIAKLAKEVARLEVNNSTANGTKRELVDRETASKHHELVQTPAFQPRSEAEIQHFASTGIHSNMYFEHLDENIECAMEASMEVATAMPIEVRGTGSSSWSFLLSDVILHDNLADIPMLLDPPNIEEDHNVYGDVLYYSHDYSFQ